MTSELEQRFDRYHSEIKKLVERIDRLIDDKIGDMEENEAKEIRKLMEEGKKLIDEAEELASEGSHYSAHKELDNAWGKFHCPSRKLK
jgi:ferritin-like metal-binding protein YciE